MGKLIGSGDGGGVRRHKGELVGWCELAKALLRMRIVLDYENT